MLRLRSAALLLTAGALAGCSAQLTNAAPAVATRPAQKMTQTDFVIRVVDYSCQMLSCKKIGLRNANLGSPGVRATIHDMCWQHMYASSSFDRAPMTTDCFDKATMSVGDPGLNQIWSQCQALNPKRYFAATCYSQALLDLVQQGADAPISSMIPGALTDQPSATPAAVAVAAPPAMPPLAPSCAEWIAVIQACNPLQKAVEEGAMVQRFSEKICAERLPGYKRSRGACADKAGASVSGPTVASGGDATSRGVGTGVFLSAAVLEARLSNGLLVAEVAKGTGPHRAGLRAGDIITNVGGAAASVAGWAKAHLEAGLGGTIRVAVKHNNHSEELEWTVAKCDHPSCVCKVDGLCSRPGDASPRQSMSLRMRGNRVEDALEGPGRAAGIQAGDEILRINEIPVRDVYSVVEIVGQLEMGAAANVTYARGGKESKVAVKLAAPAN